MTCYELFEKLERYHAGLLSQAEAEAVEQHLLGCDACAADFRFQRSLRTRTAGLAENIAPPHELWPGIRDRIRGDTPAETAPRFWHRPRVLIAAAITLMALSSGLTALLTRSGTLQPRADSGDFQATEVGYRQAADELERTLQAHRKQLGEPAFKVIEQNLQIIDQAISESQTALASDPRNTRVAELLWASYEKKIDLLQRAAESVES